MAVAAIVIFGVARFSCRCYDEMQEKKARKAREARRRERLQREQARQGGAATEADETGEALRERVPTPPTSASAVALAAGPAK